MNPWDVPWRELFVPSVPIAEIVVRGSLMYLGVFAVLRLLLRRQPGGLALSDLLILVLVADASQQGMAGDYISITDGVVLVLTIVVWNYLIDWMAFKVHALNRLVYRHSTLLMKDGEIVKDAAERELVTQEELRSALRQQGVWSFEDVAEARMESNGSISVRTRAGSPGPKANPPGAPGARGPGAP